MTGEIGVALRVLAYITFSALGGFLVARGILTEEQALALVSDEFLGAVVAVSGNGAVYLFYWAFSEAKKAMDAWRDRTETGATN